MTLFDSGAPLRLGDDVWRHARGEVLVGGAPLRAMRVSAAAARDLADRVIRPTGETSRALYDRLLDTGMAHPDPADLPPVPGSALTAVIPTLGRVDQVDLLVGLLAGIRVIVVDDGSGPSDARRLRETADRHGAELIRLEANAGPASARDAGLRAVRSPLVAFLDSDARATTEDLLLLARHFADPGLALVGPRIVGSGASGSWIERYEDSRSSLDLGRRPALVRPRATVSWISSTCLVARTDALGEGFRPGMRVAEDVDLVWRLAEHGWRVRYEPRVRVAHRHRTRAAPWLARKFFYGTGAASLAPAHPRAIVPAVVRPWSIATIALLLTPRWWAPVAAVVTATGAGLLLRRRLGRWVSPALTARLVGSGVLATLSQVAALALRHWWPVGLALAVVSRRARRLIALAAVIDSAIEHRRLGSGLDPARFALARRLDDVAYGAGVWYGSIRRRTLRPLLPEILPERRGDRRRADRRRAAPGREG